MKRRFFMKRLFIFPAITHKKQPKTPWKTTADIMCEKAYNTYIIKVGNNIYGGYQDER